MRVSVIIPTYNSSQFIGETLDSVLTQTRKPEEVIVIDDASSDDTCDVVGRFPVSLIKQPVNGGSSVARNRGIREARGDVIATIDSDDLWAPNHLEVLTGLLRRHPEAVAAASGIRLFGLEKFELFPRFEPGAARDVFDEAFEHCIVFHMAVAYRRSVAMAAGLYYEPDRYAEDMYLWMRLSLQGPFVCTHEVTAFYRKHEGQVSSVPYRQQMSRMRHRRRLVEQIHALGDVDRAAHLRNRVTAMWRRELRMAVQSRDAGAVRALLAVRDVIPNVGWHEPLLWSSAAALIPLAKLTWDRRPTGVSRRRSEPDRP